MSFSVYQVIKGNRSILGQFAFVDDALLFAREKAKCIPSGFCFVIDDYGNSLGRFDSED